MDHWVAENTSLFGERVNLMPLETKHFDQLADLVKDKRIWEFSPGIYSGPEKYRAGLALVLKEKEAGRQFPFVIIDKKTHKPVGSTRLLDLQPQHLKLEIGHTWLHPDYWATGINTECKLLLLELCFEKLNCIRVFLKTDEKNIRSRTAIQKIGGQFEGIFRNDIIRENGTYRNSAYYSIIENEWTGLKERLKGMTY